MSISLSLYTIITLICFPISIAIYTRECAFLIAYIIVQTEFITEIVFTCKCKACFTIDLSVEGVWRGKGECRENDDIMRSEQCGAVFNVMMG